MSLLWLQNGFHANSLRQTNRKQIETKSKLSFLRATNKNKTMKKQQQQKQQHQHSHRPTPYVVRGVNLLLLFYIRTPLNKTAETVTVSEEKTSSVWWQRKKGERKSDGKWYRHRKLPLKTQAIFNINALCDDYSSRRWHLSVLCHVRRKLIDLNFAFIIFFCSST